MNIVICDDEQIYADQVGMVIEVWAENKQIDDCSVLTFASAEALLETENQEDGIRADIYFLDIRLGSMDGFELGVQIRKRHPQVPIVFLTNYDTYIREAYEIQAYRYLSKPVQEKPVVNCLDFAYGLRKRNLKTVSVNVNGETIVLKINDIVWVNQAYHRIHIYGKGGLLAEIQSRNSFSKYIEKMFGDRFVICSQSDAVNPGFVSKYSKKMIFLDTGEELTVTRNFREKTYEKLNAFFRGEIE